MADSGVQARGGGLCTAGSPCLRSETRLRTRVATSCLVFTRAHCLPSPGRRFLTVNGGGIGSPLFSLLFFLNVTVQDTAHGP